MLFKCKKIGCWTNGVGWLLGWSLRCHGTQKNELIAHSYAKQQNDPVVKS